MRPRKVFNSKSGQIQVTFNWIFILIVGAIILTFFTWIVINQQSTAEKQIAGNVVKIMDTIFTGAGVSENTKNLIDSSGLADYTLTFDCSDGVGEFGIKDKGVGSQNNIIPIFAPLEIKSPRLITWSLPYMLPFKGSDLLFITSPNTKYYLAGMNDDFMTEFIEEAEDFGNVERVIDYQGIDPGDAFQVRIVDNGGGIILSQNVPLKLRELEDDKVTAVVISGDSVSYYQKDGTSWSNQGSADIVSLNKELDAAKYAAIFAGSPDVYKCSMGKAFERLSYVTKVQQAKLEDLEVHYQSREPTGLCMGYISANEESNLKDGLLRFSSRLNTCWNHELDCDDLILAAQSVQTLNHDLVLNCIPLY